VLLAARFSYLPWSAPEPRNVIPCLPEERWANWRPVRLALFQAGLGASAAGAAEWGHACSLVEEMAQVIVRVVEITPPMVDEFEVGPFDPS
jgi:hypothetical protein